MIHVIIADIEIGGVFIAAAIIIIVCLIGMESAVDYQYPDSGGFLLFMVCGLVALVTICIAVALIGRIVSSPLSVRLPGTPVTH